jgi:hypothetical protein
MKEAIERRIEQILAMDDLSAQAFSQALFGPNGLFNELASSEAERRNIAGSALFQRANARLTELQRGEVAELDQLAKQRRAARTSSGAEESNGPAAAPATAETRQSGSAALAGRS